MSDLLMSMSVPLKQIICVVIAYLLGSIPTSYLIGRIFFNTDIRDKGSGNTGATNALRTMGTKAGIAVLVIDVLKGMAAVLIARFIMRHALTSDYVNLTVNMSGLAVVLGHIFSVFLLFRGGKGVATAAGVFIVLLPIPFIYCMVLFALVVYMTKYVSLGSLLTAFAFLMIELFFQIISKFPDKSRFLLVLIVVLLIIFKHKPNLKRLIEGTENKINIKKQEEKA